MIFEHMNLNEKVVTLYLILIAEQAANPSVCLSIYFKKWKSN